MNGSQHGVCLILHKPVTQSARQPLAYGQVGVVPTILVVSSAPHNLCLRHVRSLWPGKEVPAVLQLLLTDWLRIRLVVCRSVWSVGRLFNLSAYKTVAHAVRAVQGNVKCEPEAAARGRQHLGSSNSSRPAVIVPAF